MKRRIDKNKVYAFIGRVTVATTLYVSAVGLFIFGFLQNTIY